MYHYIGSIEYVVPEGNMLDIDEIDDAAIDEAVQDIADASTSDEAEADIFMALNSATSPQVNNQGCDQAHAEKSKYRSMSL